MSLCEFCSVHYRQKVWGQYLTEISAFNQEECINLFKQKFQINIVLKKV